MPTRRRQISGLKIGKKRPKISSKRQKPKVEPKISSKRQKPNVEESTTTTEKLSMNSNLSNQGSSQPLNRGFDISLSGAISG
jgi:hypothetical protein